MGYANDAFTIEEEKETNSDSENTSNGMNDYSSTAYNIIIHNAFFIYH